MNESFCSRCDVFGHEQGSGECDTYYNEVEKPHHDARRDQIGEVRGLTEDTEMWDVESNSRCVWMSQGTPVRLTAWTPWQEGFKAGDYWTICTLDRKYSATQIKDYELGEPGILDKLALIKEEKSE